METRYRYLLGSGLLLMSLLVLALCLAAPEALGLAAESPAEDYNLLTNPGLEAYEDAYGQFEGVDCQVASGWQRFWHGDWEPCFMDDRVFANSHLGTGWVDSMEGETSQLMVSTEPYTAGLWQQVGGLTPGLGYGFHAAQLTIFQTSDQPPVHGTMIKQVGLDPTGGTDPEAPTVIWSEIDDLDQDWAVSLRAVGYAEAPTVTGFIRVTSPYSAGPSPFLNLSFLDSSFLAQTPLVTATSPAVSEVPTFTVRWDDVKVAPGFYKLRKRDVQWLDEAEGTWHDWITQTFAESASFVGERGHAYRFRARVFQKYKEGPLLPSPYRPEGDTRTYVVGSKLVGRVLRPTGSPIQGATVSVSGTGQMAASDADGSYAVDIQYSPGPQTVTVSHQDWSAPSPRYGLAVGPTETVTFTWTLRPPHDAVVNGEFEAGLDGWMPISDPGGTPVVVEDPVHTGFGALALGSSAPASSTVGVSQTVVLTRAWKPYLSFLYYPSGSDAEDRFNLVLTIVTQTVSSTLPVTTTQLLTPSLTAEGWRHQWLYAGPPKAHLTGTVTIRLQMWNDGDGSPSTVYVDEVSLGTTPGGPFVSYLPMIVRQQ